MCKVLSQLALGVVTDVAELKDVVERCGRRETGCRVDIGMEKHGQEKGRFPRDQALSHGDGIGRSEYHWHLGSNCAQCTLSGFTGLVNYRNLNSSIA